MFSGIWRKAKKKNMKKERKFGLKEFPRPLEVRIGGTDWIPELPDEKKVESEIQYILIFRNERDKGWMIMGLEQSREHKE